MLRILALILVMCICFLLPMLALREENDPPASTAEPSSMALPSPSPAVQTDAPNFSYRAVWISYLEWQQMDFTSEDVFEAQVADLFANCADIGLNVAIVQVRPFGDALYPSELFPFSHLCTGTQGQDPGFDPLAILVAQAHHYGLEIEAWVNPYRLQSGGIPGRLSPDSPAVLHPDWVKEANGGLWLDPANEEVQAFLTDGVQELCENYAIDGIHFDDYFYPTTDPSFDAESYAEYCSDGGALSPEEWRRENVNTLVAACYDAAHSCAVRFGIAPQGNLQNNRDVQYSDVQRWLAEPGFVDYLMPQMYWGLTWANDGDDSAALGDCLSQWLALPRSEEVDLYVGLGAYRIGDGDGSDGSRAEWNSGHALGDQIRFLAEKQISGFALYRYDSLFNNTCWPDLAGQEVSALRELLA